MDFNFERRVCSFAQCGGNILSLSRCLAGAFQLLACRSCNPMQMQWIIFKLRGLSVSSELQRREFSRSDLERASTQRLVLVTWRDMKWAVPCPVQWVQLRLVFQIHGFLFIHDGTKIWWHNILMYFPKYCYWLWPNRTICSCLTKSLVHLPTSSSVIVSCGFNEATNFLSPHYARHTRELHSAKALTTKVTITIITKCNYLDSLFKYSTVECWLPIITNLVLT